MWAFLTGVGATTVLVIATYFVLDAATVTSVERVENVSIIVDDEISGYEIADPDVDQD